MKDPLLRRVLVRNAVANLASGVAGAILAVVLPPFLVRLLERDTFSVWALMLQVGGYVGLLNLGLQTAVGRFVAYAEASKDSEHRDQIVSTAIALLSGSAIVGILVVAGLAALIRQIFPSIPEHLQSQAQLALVWVGGGLAVGLPFSVMNGVFVGMQRNEIPAIIIVLGRLLTAAGLILTAKAGYGLLAMSIVFTTINMISYLAQWVSLNYFLPALQISIKKVRKKAYRELVDYCSSLTIWSFAMILVSGLDLVIVARFDFPAVGAFAIASGLLAMLMGAQSAVLNVFLPVGAALYAQGDITRLRNVLFDTTLWNFLALGGAIVTYCIIGQMFLSKYIGTGYSIRVGALLGVLLMANVIRLSMAPYALLAIGVGDHRRIVLSPLAEGGTNLVMSMLLGWHFGAIGVAYGTLIGSVIGVGLHLFLNLPRSERLGVSLLHFANEAYIPAFLIVIPWIVLLSYKSIYCLPSGWPTWFEIMIAVGGSIIAAIVSRNTLGNSWKRNSAQMR